MHAPLPPSPITPRASLRRSPFFPDCLPVLLAQARHSRSPSQSARAEGAVAAVTGAAAATGAVAAAAMVAAVAVAVAALVTATTQRALPGTMEAAAVVVVVVRQLATGTAPAAAT